MTGNFKILAKVMFVSTWIELFGSWNKLAFFPIFIISLYFGLMVEEKTVYWYCTVPYNNYDLSSVHLTPSLQVQIHFKSRALKSGGRRSYKKITDGRGKKNMYNNNIKAEKKKLEFKMLILVLKYMANT